MNDVSKKIVNYLKEKYSAQMVVLHGSRATENYNKDSDWDFFVFTEQNIKAFPEFFDGHHLDVELIQLPFDSDFILKTAFGPIQDMKVLYDEKGLADALIKKTIEARSSGPNALSDQEYANRKNRLNRILIRIKRYEQSPVIQYYYLGYLFELALRYWFELNNKWPLPPYKAVGIIRAEDPKFFEDLKKIVEQDNNTGAAESIYKKLFE